MWRFWSRCPSLSVTPLPLYDSHCFDVFWPFLVFFSVGPPPALRNADHKLLGSMHEGTKDRGPLCQATISAHNLHGFPTVELLSPLADQCFVAAFLCIWLPFLWFENRKMPKSTTPKSKQHLKPRPRKVYVGAQSKGPLGVQLFS